MARLLTAALLTFAPARISSFTISSSTATRLYSSTSSLQMTKRVLVPIADGSEEIETTCIQDTLVRCGAEVTVASVMKDQLTCKMSRGIKITADILIDEAVGIDWDLVVLPGGMPGATHLRDSVILGDILDKQIGGGKKYGAICAAPAVVLADKGMIQEGASVTCYPAPQFREKLGNPTDDSVVVSGQLTTATGPGTAIKFALELGEQLFGKEVRDKIEKEMLVA